MILSRRIPARLVLGFGLPITLGAMAWAAFVYALHAYAGLGFLRVPFLPISTIGTAVAFYVGFKNNSAYDRFWEGRKIWGGVVNSSRTWATYVMSYVLPGDASPEAEQLLGPVARASPRPSGPPIVNAAARRPDDSHARSRSAQVRESQGSTPASRATHTL